MTRERKSRLAAHMRLLAALTLGLLALTALAGCGIAASAAGCSDSVATVGAVSITKPQFDVLLNYTLDFYERASPGSPYFGQEICRNHSLASECLAVKRALVNRMVDQQIVSTYAASHNLLPTGADWNRGLVREQRLVRLAGGQSAFNGFLARIGTSQARFRWLESQQIETSKVMRAVGASRFGAWLRNQVAKAKVVHCPVG